MHHLQWFFFAKTQRRHVVHAIDTGMFDTNDIAPNTAVSGDKPEDEWLLWILVWSELVTFAILLIAFMIVSIINIEGVAQFRSHLSPGLAAANTVVLLLSGWQAAVAVRARHNINAVRRPLLFSALFGLVFVAVKLVEYSHELPLLDADATGMLLELYFLLTGFHLMHVLFGSIILALVAWRPSTSNVILITTLWHAIDLVWLVMFPVLYLA